MAKPQANSSETCVSQQRQFIELAIDLAVANVETNGGGPFGAVIVKDGKVIATGVNSVVANSDPTAHAEVVAIRKACEVLNSFQLDGCEIYTSCEPCPMCLGAIYWARLRAVFYAADQADAARAGFDDSFIYGEFELAPEDRKLRMIQVPHERAVESFERWAMQPKKTSY